MVDRIRHFFGRLRNRFRAEAVTLRQLRDRGYAPRVLIVLGDDDDWAQIASSVFPKAELQQIDLPMASSGAESILPEDRALLKIGGNRHEVPDHAGPLLAAVEVVSVKVPFFTPNRRPTFSAYLAYFDAAGFAVYDFASLTGRPRDARLREGEILFIRRDSALAE